MSSSFITAGLFLVLLLVGPISATKRNLITFRSPNLFPESITYDPHPSSNHFLIGSLHHRSIHSLTPSGHIQTLLTDESLPPNATIAGLAVDPLNRRLLAVVNSLPPLPPFNALAAYNLTSLRRIFLSPLTNNGDLHLPIDRPVANDVAVDFRGNAFVTDSKHNLIWKVNTDGEASVFSESPTFRAYPVPRDLPPSDLPYRDCGLNGIAYVSKGYLLVVQSNTGKLFKVDAEDGRTMSVLLNKELIGADGVAVRNDGVVVVVSQYKLWLLKSQDSWAEAVVYDEIALNTEKFPTSVAVNVKGNENKAYVLYGNVNEGILGKGEREVFGVEEILSAKDSDDDLIWVFVLVGLAMAYFMFWRFQMGQLAKSMNKKIN